MPGDVAFKGAEIAFIYPPDHPNIDKLGIYNGMEETTGLLSIRDAIQRQVL